MYYAFHVFGFIGAAIYMLLFTPKYGIERKIALILTVITYTTVYALMLLLYYIATGNFGGQNIVRVFVFIPPIVALYAAAFGINVRKALDLIAPVPCIVHGISHLGCLFPGCCYSRLRVNWGIYNKRVGERLFPVQICEALTAVLIAVILILIMRKNQYDLHGKAMPLMLILFGTTRFIWEFLRDNAKLLWEISDLALWGIGMAIAGAVWLFVDSVIRRKRGTTIV